MLKPPIPPDEAQRVAALRSLDVLFTSAEGRFDRITRLASRLLGAPISLVSLIGDDCQWFKSSQGLAASETPRDISFCGHAILADATFVVEDTLCDPRFVDNPLVTGEPHIRFYAGHPLHSVDGSRVGTLCVIDREPRRLAREQLDVLRDLAALVESELQRCQLSETHRSLVAGWDDAQRRAMTDAQTRVWSRQAVLAFLGQEISGAPRHGMGGIVLVRMDDAAIVRQRDGAAAADALLREVAERIRRAVRRGDAVGRYDTDEFLVVLRDGDLMAARGLADGIRDAVVQEPVHLPAGLLDTSVRIGAAAFSTRDDCPDRMVAAARAALAA